MALDCNKLVVHDPLLVPFHLNIDRAPEIWYVAWVRKAPTKEPEFDLERMKGTFMEAKKSFMEASTSGSKDQREPRMDPSMLTTFMETSMKL